MSKENPEPDTSTGSDVRRKTLRRLRYLLVTGAAAGVYACDGPVVADPLPPPPTTTTVPGQALLEVAVFQASQYPQADGAILVVELLVTENAGLGANINYIRADLLRDDETVEERREIGAKDIIGLTGSNRIEARESRDDSFGFSFQARLSRRRIRLTVSFTDDLANDLEIANDFRLN